MSQLLWSEAEFSLIASQKHWPCFTAEQLASIGACWIMTQVTRICKHPLTVRITTSAVLYFEHFSFPDLLGVVLEYL